MKGYRWLTKPSLNPHRFALPGGDLHGINGPDIHWWGTVMNLSVSRVTTLAPVLGFLMSVLASVGQASPLSEEVVQLSPLGAIADQSQAMLKTGIRDGLVGTGQVDPFVAETLAGVGSRALNAQAIRSKLASDLAGDLDSTQLETVRDWYQSDLGQQVADAESAAASPVNWEAVQVAADSLRERFDGTSREQLFDRYNSATQATDTAVETTVAVQLELADALASMSRKDTAESVRAQVEGNRPVIERQVRDQVYLAFLSMYESFSDEELENYLTFLESSSGRAYTDSAGDAIQDAIMAPVASVGSQLVKLLGTGSGSR